MISEAEMPDVCEKLDKLTIDCWHATSSEAKADVKAEYRMTWQAACLSGFKINRRRVKDEFGTLIGVKHSFKAREAKKPGVDVNGKAFNLHCKNNIADLKIVDMRPAGFKTLSGYCSTNAMAQAISMPFEAIYKKQRKYGPNWNSMCIIRKILSDNGYQQVTLPKKLATFKVADKLFSIKTPIIAESSYHITCIDNRGTKPCVNDLWDSRRCKIKHVFVKATEADRVRRILDRDDI